MFKTEIGGVPIAEWIGYLASLGILISFLMKDIQKLRLINSVGCLLFAVYGFLLDVSWPIVVTNVSIVIINLFYLIKPAK